jgi:type IV pilus assembly protein PilY1
MRGGRTAEGIKFRSRGLKDQGIMGPIVSSTPWVQDRRFTARYSDGVFPSTAPSYRAYVTSKAREQSLLWVGSNDGMLHGVKVSDGTPVLSYVPGPLVGRLSSALSVKNTESVALMDGSPFTADVLVPTSSQSGATQAWRTYLFSGLGRGGRGLFALDVTPAASLSTTAAASTFKWMFTAADDAWSNGTVSESSDLGYNLQDPVRHNVSGQATPVVYLNDGNFWLLHPNGHRSDSGRAVLFLFKVNGSAGGAWRDAQTGATNGYIKLPTEQGNSATATPNGLMGVTWVDLDNNETADLVYGTDLKGQLWRFDLRDSNPANWRVGLFSEGVEGAQDRKEGIPLFTARDASGEPLPITSAPAATLPSYGGIMLSFGTGRALETGDFPDVSRPQRFFTVWDRGGYAGDRTFAAPKVFDAQTQGLVEKPNALPALGRTVEKSPGVSVQTFIRRHAFRDQSGNVYLAQTNADGTVKTDAQGKAVPLGATDLVTRFDPAVHDGWFFEFPDAGSQGEAVISSPGVRSGYVFFTSVRGQTAQEQEQACAQAPSSTLYALSPVNGLPVNSLLVNGAYYLGVPVDDQKLIVVRDRSGETISDGSGSTCTGTNCPAEPAKPACQCSGGTVALRALGGSGGTSQCMCVPATSLRIQWRELPGLRTQ